MKMQRQAMRISNVVLGIVLLGLLVFMLHASPTGCQGSTTPQSDLPTTRMKIGKRTFTLEIANTPAARERGLMFRQSMPEDHGMIFVFPDQAVRRFWMRNTRIPLDIIFVNSDQTIVAIEPMKPFDESGTSSRRPAKYAIELNRGMAEKAGVKVGDQLEIPSAARETER